MRSKNMKKQDESRRYVAISVRDAQYVIVFCPQAAWKQKQKEAAWVTPLCRDRDIFCTTLHINPLYTPINYLKNSVRSTELASWAAVRNSLSCPQAAWEETRRMSWEVDTRRRNSSMSHVAESRYLYSTPHKAPVYAHKPPQKHLYLVAKYTPQWFATDRY